MIRTRFAPSPTGFLHIGGARTALFAWAYARRFGGQFVLRIEDTDVERSTPESVKAILEGMRWLGLDYDDGPHYQMQRMPRYKQVIQQLLDEGKAYYCYASREELDEMREAQRARGEKPRYDGRWRDSTQVPPQGVQPVVRFKNPVDGVVTWDDQVKGTIEIANAELDDLIIARSDGTPTYNFCVVVDDWDMKISHVIRGDDHVNNTPRQINILQALGAPIPAYAHLPMILREDGKKMSKRDNDVVSVVEYANLGILPQALLNYLARLGWSHGDAEFFSLEQFIQWFDLTAITPSAARFNPEKLLWVNQQHIQALPIQTLCDQISSLLGEMNYSHPPLPHVLALLKERDRTLVDLANSAKMFYAPLAITAEDEAKHLTPDALAAVQLFGDKLAVLPAWIAEDISAALKAVLAETGLKMPKVAIPVRLMLFGTTQTPSIDAMLSTLGSELTLQRLDAALQRYCG